MNHLKYAKFYRKILRNMEIRKENVSFKPITGTVPIYRWKLKRIIKYPQLSLFMIYLQAYSNKVKKKIKSKM